MDRSTNDAMDEAKRRHILLTSFLDHFNSRIAIKNWPQGVLTKQEDWTMVIGFWICKRWFIYHPSMIQTKGNQHYTN